MAKLPRCYWDSTCFLAWLKPEEEHKRACQEVISAAERGEIQIVTSAVSLTEVIKLHKGLPIEIPKEHEERIVTFFQQEYIVVVQVTRFIAEDARSLIWRFPSLKPKDALHAANCGLRPGALWTPRRITHIRQRFSASGWKDRLARAENQEAADGSAAATP